MRHRRIGRRANLADNQRAGRTRASMPCVFPALSRTSLQDGPKKGGHREGRQWSTSLSARATPATSTGRTGVRSNVRFCWRPRSCGKRRQLDDSWINSRAGSCTQPPVNRTASAPPFLSWGRATNEPNRNIMRTSKRHSRRSCGICRRVSLACDRSV